mgnify:CR=1 FL=1|jgi:predicted HD superfamily hydrolase involved in NAD metabolism
MLNKEEITKLVAKHLSEYRFQHCLRTAAYAKELAKHWQIEPEKAYIAGLCHDLGKDCSREEALALLKDAGIVLDADTLSNDSLLHPYSGMVLAKNECGIEDKEILEAIRTHTVGEPGMTRLQKIIFLADLLEEGREFPGIQELRELVWQDLDTAMSKALAINIQFVETKGLKPHPDAIRALDYYGKK